MVGGFWENGFGLDYAEIRLFWPGCWVALGPGPGFSENRLTRPARSETACGCGYEASSSILFANYSFLFGFFEKKIDKSIISDSESTFGQTPLRLH